MHAAVCNSSKRHDFDEAIRGGCVGHQVAWLGGYAREGEAKWLRVRCLTCSQVSLPVLPPLWYICLVSTTNIGGDTQPKLFQCVGRLGRSMVSPSRMPQVMFPWRQPTSTEGIQSTLCALCFIGGGAQSAVVAFVSFA